MATTSIQLIRTPEEITPPWLTDALRIDGTLGDDQRVERLHAVSLGDAAGLLGELYRVTITYSAGAAGPSSLVIKLPSTDPQQRGVADALGFYKREITFYNDYAEGLPFAIPRSYGAVQATDSTDFVLIMEDVGHLHQIDQVAGASLDQARAAIATIARFHARWWEHPELEVLGETFVPLSAPIYRAALPGIFESGWATCKHKEQANLTPEVIEFADNYGSTLPFLLDELATPATMVHGDFRGDNLLFDDDGDLSVLDFQITGVANGVYDIAYFACQSIATDVRRGNDDELVRLYVDTLATEGIELPLDLATRKYRLATAFCLIYAVTSYQAYDAFDGRQHQLMSSMLSRTVEAMIDNDSLSLIP